MNSSSVVDGERGLQFKSRGCFHSEAAVHALGLCPRSDNDHLRSCSPGPFCKPLAPSGHCLGQALENETDNLVVSGRSGAGHLLTAAVGPSSLLFAGLQDHQAALSLSIITAQYQFLCCLQTALPVIKTTAGKSDYQNTASFHSFWFFFFFHLKKIKLGI